MLSVKKYISYMLSEHHVLQLFNKKLILLLKVIFQELFFMNYIFMLVDLNSTVYVITSLNRFYITAILAVTNLLPS